jgi:hypothetical protein
MENTIEIGSFTDYFQATLAKEILESNGVHCIITGVNLSIIDTTSETKIKLIINKDDLNKAEELLSSFFS